MIFHRFSHHIQAPHETSLYKHLHLYFSTFIEGFIASSSLFINPFSPLSPCVHLPTPVWPSIPTASPPICHLNWGCLSLWWQWASCQPNTLPPARTAFRIDSRPAIRQGVTGCPTPAFKVQYNAVSGCILCLVASGNTTQRPNSKYGRCVLHCALCCGFIFPEGYGLERKKKAYRVIITVLRAHRGYASFNFTLYSTFPPVCSVSLSASLSLSLSLFLCNPPRQCWQQRYDRGGPAGAEREMIC